jgi:hypothetical protein
MQTIADVVAALKSGRDIKDLEHELRCSRHWLYGLRRLVELLEGKRLPRTKPGVPKGTTGHGSAKYVNLYP